MEIGNRETYGLLAVVLLLLIRQYPVNLAIQNFMLRGMRRRRLRLRFLQRLQMLYLYYGTRRLQVDRRPRRAWVFPRPQNWFQELLNNLESWPCLMPRVLNLVRARMFAAISAQHHKNVPSMCCGSRIYFFLPPDWLNYSCG